MFYCIKYERKRENDAPLQMEWLQKILRFDRMDRLLMTLGFTESKSNSNLYFKVEGGIPVTLMLYVNDLFLTEKRNSLKLQEGYLLLS